MNNTDKYFNEKLLDIKKAPPIGAWHNIEKGMAAKANKKRGVIYMSVAASISIMIIFGFIIYSNQNFSKKRPENMASNEQSKRPVQIDQQMSNNSSEEKRAMLESDKVEVKKQPLNEKQGIIETQKEPLPKKKIQQKTEPIDTKDPVKMPQTIGPISPLDQNKEWVAEQAKKIISDTIQIKPVNLEKSELLAENTEKASIIDKYLFVEITLEIEEKEEELLASIEEDKPKMNFKKLKRAMDREWYKQKIKLGDVSHLAFNKIKIGSN